MNGGEKVEGTRKEKYYPKQNGGGCVSFWALSVIENKTLDLFYEE